MWKYVAIGCGVASLGLSIACVRLMNQVDVEHAAAVSESEARQRAEDRVKTLQASLYRTPVEFPVETAPTRKMVPSSSVATTASPPADRNDVVRIANRRPFAPYADEYSRMRPPPRNIMSDLARTLHLSDTDKQKLQRILDESQDKMRLLAEGNGGNPFDPAELNAMQKETDNRVLDLLGDEKYQQYQDYSKDMPEHMRISQLNERLSDEGQNTLSPEQQQQLLTVMKQERTTEPRPNQQGFGTRADFDAAMRDWRNGYEQRVETRASPILTPEQLNQLRNVRGPPRRG
jgi:hypothetical protein